MKKTIISLLLISHSLVLCQWYQSGEFQKLKVNDSEIRDYSISTDSKFIYTLDKNNIIKKWDYHTGDSLSSYQVKPENLKLSPNKWIFLSTDGLTYCTSYFTRSIESIFNTIIIHDITDNSTIIDTTISSKLSPGATSAIYSYIDFDYQNNKIFCSLSWNLNKMPPYNVDVDDGIIKIIQKIDGIWTSIREFYGFPRFMYLSNCKEGIIHLEKKTDYESYGPPSDPKYYSHTLDTKDVFFISDSNKYQDISQYHYFSDHSGHNTSGRNYDFKSAFFNNNKSKFYLSEYNKIYKFNIPLNKFENTETLNIYSDKFTYKIININNDDLFLVINSDSMNVHNLHNMELLFTFLTDSIGNIIDAKKTNDNNLIISHSNGYLYKIDIDSLIRLRANFSTDDNTYAIEDTIKFHNKSIGFPDSCFWDFGDGSNSTESEPLHVYKIPGNYTIKLIVFKNSNTDMIIKNQYLQINKFINVAFDYLLNGDFPVKLKLINQTIGDIDSLDWKINKNYAGNSDTLIMEYYQSGIYQISLTVYSNNLIKTLTKDIEIKVILPELDNNKFDFEFIDTTNINSIAKTGYFEGNKIIYHIIGSKIEKYGVFSNFIKDWENEFINGKIFLLQKNLNKYTILNDTLAFNFDIHGNQSDIKTIINSKSLFSVTNYRDNLFLSIYGSYHASYDVISDHNDKLYNKSISTPNYNPYVNTYTFDNLIVIQTADYRIDFAESYDVVYLYQYNTPTYVYEININNKKIPYKKLTDFIRLNDSVVIYNSNNFIEIYKNYGMSIDTSISLPDIMEKIYQNTFSGLNIKKLLKLNDTSFIMIGDNSKFPVYIILNDKGHLLDSVILENRFGSFEFVSITPDLNLLFSGYRYSNYKHKSPYFVKTSDYLIKKLIIKNDLYLVNDDKDKFLNFPNPTNSITTLLLSFNQISTVKLYLYNSLGELVYQTPEKIYDIGDNQSIELNFSNYSIGYYYCILNINNKQYYGNIVYTR